MRSLLTIHGLFWVLGASSPALAQETGASTQPTPESAAESQSAAASPTARQERLLQKGTEADLLQARSELESMVAEGTDDAFAWYLLGVVHFRLGSQIDAADAFARSTQLDPSLAMAWVGLGEAEAALGDVDTALRRFDQGLATSPDSARLLEAKVHALRLAGRFDAAIDTAKDALKEHALQLGLYHEMGHAWLGMDKLALASFVFEKAETVPGGSDSAMVATDIGWTRYLLDKPYAAKKTLERAVDLDGSYLPALVALARVRYDDRDFEAMITLLETASELDPEAPNIWMDLGVAYRGLGRLEDAKTAFIKARELAPRDPEPLFNLGVLYADDLKEYQLGIDKLQSYLAEGGAQVDKATAYLEDIEKEKERVERREQARERRRKREEERARQQELLDEGSDDASSTDSTDSSSPSDEGTSGGSSPWDGGGEQR